VIHALVDFSVLISMRITDVCDDFVIVIVLLLVIDRSEHEHDYHQEHEGSLWLRRQPRCELYSG
jgi:hypothetical protein